LDGRALQNVLLEPDPGTIDSAYPRAIEDADVGNSPPVMGCAPALQVCEYADGHRRCMTFSGIHTNKNSVLNIERYQSIKAQMQALLPQAKACRAASCRTSAPLVLQIELVNRREAGRFSTSSRT